MSQPPGGATSVVQQPPNLYKFAALGALLLLTMALLEKQLGIVAFLPACFGMLGVIGNWRPAPLLVLGSLALAIPIGAAGFVPRNPLEFREFMTRLSSGRLARARRIEPIPDFLACAALLAYLGAYFRLKGVERNVFPRDTRKPAPAGRGPAPRATQARPVRLVQASELMLFLASLPIFCGLAALALFWLVRMSSQLVLFPDPLRAPLLFLWLAGLSLALLAVVMGYQRALEAEPADNLQFLQDQLWRGTRSEQARIHRWFTWDRLRGQQRKEKP